MPLIDNNGKLFGLINLLDGVVTVAVIAGVIGVATVKAGYTAVDRMGTKGPAQVDVLIRANIEDLSMFKAGDKTFVTIRNVPYNKVQIVAVQAARTQEAIPTHDGESFRLTTDPTQPYASTVKLTLQDQGMETEDGIVWGGQKLKVGEPVDLEGLRYRLVGSVIDVRMVQGAKQ